MFEILVYIGKSVLKSKDAQRDHSSSEPASSDPSASSRSSG